MPKFSTASVGHIALAWLASNALWALAAPGLGTAVSAVLTAFVDIAQPWRSFFFVGCLMVGTGLVLGVVRPLVAARLPQPLIPVVAPPTDAELAHSESIAARAEDERKRERQYRVIAQEALTTLEFQRAKVIEHRSDFNPWHQGAWPQNRDFFFEETRNAKAGRLTERAFIALQKITNPVFAGAPGTEEAIAVIDAAIPELESIAGIG